MKCNNCGYEFGIGLNCQHCGIDRVEGLGSLNGLSPNSRGGSSLTPGSTTPGGISVADSKNMLCYSCGEIIPGVAKFCPYCKAEQYVVCPKCGIRYLAQYPSCYECGTEREKYLIEQEVEKKKREEEAALREAKCPVISSFKVSKYSNTGDRGIVFKWSCINVESCNLTCLVDINLITVRDDLRPIGTKYISVSEMIDWLPVFRTPTRIGFRLEAKGIYGDLRQETLWLGIRWPWLSRLEIII